MIEISDSTRWRHRIGVQLAAGFFASLLVGCVEPTARALPDPKKTRTEADLNRDLENSLAAVIQREGQAKADAMMRDSVPDSQKQAEGAAAFWSFYLRNTRSRVEFCQTHSVDVSTFVRKFTAAGTFRNTLLQQGYLSVRGWTANYSGGTALRQWHTA